MTANLGSGAGGPGGMSGQRETGEHGSLFSPEGCTGALDCPSPGHIHGCFADYGNCTDPDAHCDCWIPALEGAGQHSGGCSLVKGKRSAEDCAS